MMSSGGRISENKIVLVKRKTRLEKLVVRYNTVQQAQFYIERLGADFSDYISEDLTYRQAVETAVIELSALGRVQVLERQHVPNFIFGDEDTVIVLGQDGLVANTLKYLQAQPLIGVNPDPQRWDGVLLPFTVKDLRLLLPEVFRSRRQVREVTLAKAELNDGQSLYGVNDLFIGRRTHVSARYLLQHGSAAEQQSSSGIIVSTGLGSTGRLRSVLAGAAGITRSAAGLGLAAREAAGGVAAGLPGVAGQGQAAGEEADEGAATAGVSRDGGRYGQAAGAGAGMDSRLAWDDPNLYFTVREPFPSRTTSAGVVFGRVSGNEPLRITSQMPEDGVIFSDGVESDFLEFNSGVEAVISMAEKRGRLVV